jgi:hypothetical protein
MLLRLNYDFEPSGFLVSEQKLVDLNGLVKCLVLVLNELRLVVPECQKRASGVLARQFVFFPSMTTLKSCRPTEPMFDELNWILTAYRSVAASPAAHACADKNSSTTSAIFFTEFLVSLLLES